MQGERTIAMEAVDRARNRFRAWRCEIGTDLFGAVVLSVTFGRTLTSGRTITKAVANEAAADRLVRRLFFRRRSARRRIGVAYRVIESHGFSVDLTDEMADQWPIEVAGTARLTVSCGSR